MNKSARRKALTGAVMTSLALAGTSVAGDWSQHLGPSGLGFSPEKGVFKAGVAPKLAWKAAMQAGAGGLAVAGDRVYAIAKDDESDYAVALHLKDGKEAWRVKLDALPAGAGNLAGSGTPAVSGGKVVTVSSNCQLRAHDAATGAVAWHRDLKADYSVPAPRTCTGSPLIEGALVLAPLPGKDEAGFGAFDLATGKTTWLAQGKLRTHFAQSSLATFDGERVVLINHAIVPPPPAQGQPPARPLSGVTALRVKDGSAVFSHTMPEGFGWDAPLLLAPDRIALFTFNDLRMFSLAKDGATWKLTPLWQSTVVAGGVNPPFIAGNVLYGVRDDDLAALDAATGKLLWKHKMYYGAAYALDGHVVLLPRTSGLLQIGEVSATGWKEKARLEVLGRGPQANASPVFAGGLLLLRNDEEVAAVRLN